jgi:NitT/TauT family transport system permease protein
MVIVIPLAVGLGMLIGRNPKLRVLDEIANVGMTIPQPIFLPILFIILGSNFFEIVIFGVTHALFVIVVNSAASTRSVPPSYDQLAKLYGTKTFDLYRKIYFPFMVPVILQGIRLGLIFCVAGVMLAEMYAGNGGFGKDILYWGSSFVLPDLLAGIIVVGASTVIINGLFHMLERRGASWRNA